MGENLMTLKCIFETVDEAVLVLALEEAGGDLQRAIDATLEMTGGGGGGGSEPKANTAAPPTRSGLIEVTAKSTYYSFFCLEVFTSTSKPTTH